MPDDAYAIGKFTIRGFGGLKKKKGGEKGTGQSWAGNVLRKTPDAK